MFIRGLGTAAPIYRYDQAQCWAALQASRRFAELAPRSRAILRKVLTGENGIRTRHFAMEQLGQAFDLTPDALHARFLNNAPALAAQAAQRALADAQVEPRSVDAVLVSTCTGYLCPGLTSYVGERLGAAAGGSDARSRRARLRRGAAQPAHGGGAPDRPELRMRSFHLRRSLQRGVLSRRRSRRADQRLFVRRRRGGGGAHGRAVERPPPRGVEDERLGAESGRSRCAAFRAAERDVAQRAPAAGARPGGRTG